MPRIAVMDGVREYSEKFPVELRIDDESRRLVIRAINEAGHNCVDIDLCDLLGWLRTGEAARGIDDIQSRLPIEFDIIRNSTLV